VGRNGKTVSEADGKMTARRARPPLETANDDDLILLLVRTGKSLVDRLRAAHVPSSLTVVHGLAASHLVGRDDVTTVELARHLGMTKQSASEVVSALEAAGILRRAPHPTDGRARVLLLTDEGAAKIEAARARRVELEEEWAALVGHDRLDAVREALEAYLEADALRSDASGDCCD
jgi:DNA-binding MarR family transcriptional regulator